jgi:hypothetical protein
VFTITPDPAPEYFRKESPSSPRGARRLGAELRSELTSVSDLNVYFARVWGNFLLLAHCWWVPRPIRGMPLGLPMFPSPRLTAISATKTRTTDKWPSSTEDHQASAQPIITDLLTTTSRSEHKPADAFGGHPSARGEAAFRVWKVYGRNTLGINRAYADGRVETVGPRKIQW